MKLIITGNEICVCAYDPETTDQSSEYLAKGRAKDALRILSASQPIKKDFERYEGNEGDEIDFQG